MGRFNLNDYTEVKDRIPLFLEAYPEGRIVTELVELDLGSSPGHCAFRASLYRDHDPATPPLATGYAYEREVGQVNKTSMVENCETSAIGRALANHNLTGNGKRPSREEMEKVQRMEEPDMAMIATTLENLIAIAVDRGAITFEQGAQADKWIEDGNREAMLEMVARLKKLLKEQDAQPKEVV